MGPNNPVLKDLPDDVALPIAINDFQNMMGLERTGEMNAESMAMMRRKRCGCPDIAGKQTLIRRRKRYEFIGSFWSVKTLTWRVSGYTPDLSHNDVDSTINKAFKMWSSVADLSFVQVGSTAAADIDIFFASGWHYSHVSEEAFDGEGGVLAHAFQPGNSDINGDVHVDEDEEWTINTDIGANLLYVMVHELGHSLGLGHSTHTDAIMYPTYREYQPNLALHPDDVAGIQVLYGAPPPSSNTPAPTPSPAPTESPGNPRQELESRACSDGKVDCFLTTEDGSVYAFRQDYYMKLDSTGIMPTYPRLIKADWPDLPNDLDAAMAIEASYVQDFSTSSYKKVLPETIYFFKRTLVYMYTPSDGHWELHPGYPQQIDSTFPGIPYYLDASFTWKANDKQYFMKGTEYYRHSRGAIVEESGRWVEYVGSLDGNYPKPIADSWDGVPDDLDAAHVWVNDRLYFFKGEEYYRFNDKTLKVDSGYPRPIRSGWFGCPDSAGKTTPAMEGEVTLDDRFDGAGGGNGTNPRNSAPAPMRLVTVTAMMVSVYLLCVMMAI